MLYVFITGLLHDLRFSMSLIGVIIIFLTLAPSIEGRATCDNNMKMYADGELVMSSDVWHTADEVSLPGDTQLVAIECEDTGNIGGIKASFQGGFTTDSSWRCSAKLEEGWNQPG